MEILALVDQYRDEVRKVAEKFVGNIQFTDIFPGALISYLEYEDERKNPSWERRRHRFCAGVNLRMLESLNGILDLAHLCYSSNINVLRKGLESHVVPYELVYVDFASAPGRPANYVAVKSDQSALSSTLEVLIGVRGTKTVADALTDILCDTVDYRGGKAHAYIVNSGKHLVAEHTPLLEDLLSKSGKKTIKLTLIGHSLGGGAASIAGIEFNENPKFDVSVVGFGCPPLLSLGLAEKYKFITTIVNDSDVVPRLSGIAVANLLLDITEFDWYPYLMRDVRYALGSLQQQQPKVFSKAAVDTILTGLEPALASFVRSTENVKTVERLTPELYPPGQCIHFYRDGCSISAAYVPNDFFSEIDVRRRMIDDHLFLSGYKKTLLEMMRELKRDHNFRF